MCDVLDLIDAQVTDQARPVILVDGRSGAGKTTLATQLAARHPGWQLAVSYTHLTLPTTPYV